MFFYAVYNLHKNDLYKSGIILHRLYNQQTPFQRPATDRRHMSPSGDSDSQGQENRKCKVEGDLQNHNIHLNFNSNLSHI